MGFFASIFFMLLFAVLFILIMGINLLARLFGGIGNLWNFITGNRKASWNSRGNRQRGYTSSGSSSSGSESYTGGASANQADRPHSKGVFRDDEGTYVDFEEVKD